MINILSSNRTEKLLDALKERIYQEGSPFHRRFVALSSPVMKSFLQQEMARDSKLQIAMGVEMGYLSQLLLHACPLGWRLPNTIELAFALEEIIREKEETIEEIKNFLSHPQKEKRISRLAGRLASLFSDYGIYGQRAIEKKEFGWQGEVWEELFHRHPDWCAPFQLVEKMEVPKEASTFHIFGLNFLPPLYIRFLEKLSLHHAVFLYLLSPSYGFWGEGGTDREVLYLHRQWKKRGMSEEELLHWEEELAERHPLLANWGALRRKMDSFLDDPGMTHPVLPDTIASHPAYEPWISEEIFLEPASSLTALQAVQADMVLLRPLQDKLSLEDDSIVIYAASSKRREVQHIYDHLLHLMDKEKILPEEIVIMAPQISPYVPHIEAIFEGIETQVYDLGLAEASPSLMALQRLLSIASSRWDVVTLLDLFETPAFQRKQNFRKEEMESIREWMEKLKISWGENQEHRRAILEEETTSLGSWEEGWSRLLMMLATGKEATWVEAPLLEKWMTLFYSLRDDLSALHPASKMTLEEWKLYLQELNERYFIHDDDDAALDDVWSRWPKDLGRKFSWISMEYHLKNLLKQSSFIRRESHLQAIRVCSMLPMRAIPAKVVVLLGMCQESFPHVQEKGGMNLLRKQADYPTEKEFDCFLMLEALLSARRQIVFSYSGEHPSSLIQELIHYLERVFLKKEWITHIPFRPYDPSLFQSPPLSYSLRYFEEANASQEPTSPRPFLSFNLGEKEEKQELEIKDLLLAAKNPLKLYFQKALHLSLKEQEEELPADESFFLDSLVLHQAKMSSLKKPVDEVLSSLRAEGALPSGLFGAHAERKIRQEGVETPHEIYSITWKEGVEKPLCIDNEWFLPPLQIDNKTFLGKLEGVSTKGLISLKEESVQEWWTLWPRALLLMTLPKECSIEKKILFLHDHQEVEIDLQIDWLYSYVRYAQYVASHPVFILPKWIEKIMKKDYSFLQEEIFDPYIAWIVNRQQMGTLPWDEWEKLIAATVDLEHPAFRRIK